MRHFKWGRKKKFRPPHSEVGAVGVVPAHGGHVAGVSPDVAGPRLGDVEGALGVQSEAGRRVHVQRGAALLPHVAAGKKNRFHKLLTGVTTCI